MDAYFDYSIGQTNEQPEWDVTSSAPNYTYADEYDKGFGGAKQEGPGAIPSEGVELYPGWSGPSGFDKFLSNLKGFGSSAANFASTPQGLMALLMALANYSSRRTPSGGGGTQAFKMPTAPQQRTIVQGKYGPIARYAADGGLMHAYAHGGHVRMEDGGFVLTKRAVDGAGGPRGIAQLVPGARPIRGPGTGTSDSIPASIHGPRGVTPAKVSNGEAYVPRAAVQQAGGPERMYALMNSLQRRA